MERVTELTTKIVAGGERSLVKWEAHGRRGFKKASVEGNRWTEDKGVTYGGGDIQVAHRNLQGIRGVQTTPLRLRPEGGLRPPAPLEFCSIISGEKITPTRNQCHGQRRVFGCR